MAINFPSNPADGSIFTDPSGQQWVYDSSDKSWTALGISVDPGGLQYQGGLDITAAPPAAQSGQFWSVSVGGTANGGFAPGVTGTIPVGSFVLYDGVNWELLETSSLWNRTGGLIQPVNQNDVIQTDSGLKVGPSGTPTIELKADGSATFSNLSADYLRKGPSGVFLTSTQQLIPNTLELYNGSTDGALGVVFTNNFGGTKSESARMRNDGAFVLGGTLPSAPNITLNANGVAQAKGGFIAKQNSGYFFTGQSTSNVNSVLISADGSATFAGDLRVPNSVNDATTNDGIHVYANGQIYASRSGTNALWTGKQTAVSGYTSRINADGSAEFKGEVQINGTSGSGNRLKITQTGSAPTDQSNVRLTTPAADYILYSTGDTNALTVFDGTANTNRLQLNGSGNVLIGGTIPSSPAISLNANGSATFNDNVGIGTASSLARLQVKSNAIGIPAVGVAGTMQVGDGNAYGLMIGAASVGGTGYIQAQRSDGGAATYDLLLNPNGGNVGVGTSTPQATLDVGGSGVSVTDNVGSIKMSTNTTGQGVLATSTDNALRLQVNNADRLRLETNGTCTFTGPVSIGGTAAANTIDEYEEGNWTPSISNANATYTTQTGSYVRIGQQVTLTGQLTWTSNDAVGSIVISGVPFGTSGATSTQFGSVIFSSPTNGAPADLEYPSIETFSSSLYVRYIKSSGEVQPAWSLSANAAGRIAFNITYITSA